MVSIKLTLSTVALLALLGQSEARPTVPEEEALASSSEFLNSLYDVQAQLEAEFKAADTDGDGQITKDQLKQVIRSWNGLMTDNQVDALVDILMVVADSDEDGKVGESEVVKAVLTDVAGSTEAYFAAFYKVFDKDNSGGLNQQELTEVDRRMHGGNYALQRLLEYDQDGDKEITYQEMKDAI